MMKGAVEIISSHKIQILYCRGLIRKYSAAKLEQETRSSYLSVFHGRVAIILLSSAAIIILYARTITIAGAWNTYCGAWEDSESKHFWLLFVIMDPFEKLRRIEKFTSSFMSYQLLKKSIHKLQSNCHGPLY